MFVVPQRTSTSSWYALVVLGLSKTYFGWFGGVETVPFNPRARGGRRAPDGRDARRLLVVEGLLVRARLR